jgi:hypothetical protein
VTFWRDVVNEAAKRASDGGKQEENTPRKENGEYKKSKEKTRKKRAERSILAQGLCRE